MILNPPPLLLHSLQKSFPWCSVPVTVAGSLLLQLVLVGERHFNAFGSHGSIDHVKLSYFPTLEECCDDLRRNKGDLLSTSMLGALCRSLSVSTYLRCGHRRARDALLSPSVR